MFEIKANIIKELRIKNNLSQKQVGRMLGISDRAVSRWELGETKPTAKNLVALSKIFGVPADSFFYVTSTKNDNKIAKGMESITELYKTGYDLSSSYKETSEAGLAKIKL